MGVRPFRATASCGAARLALALWFLLPRLGMVPLALRASTAVAEERSGEPEARDPEKPDPRRLPTARVTAVRPAELPDDPTSFATVVRPEDRAGEGETVARLLDETVGVQVRSFGGPGQSSEISIRGSTGQQVVVLLDGVRLNTAQSGTVDLSTLPLAVVDRIEVARGGGSAQVGSGAIGGVVNVVTRRATGERRTDARFEGGSFGTWEGSLSHADRVGPVDWGLSYTGFTTDGDWKFQSVEFRADGEVVDESVELERVNNDSESHTVLAQLSGEPQPGLSLRGWSHFFFQSRGQPGPDDDPLAPHGGQSTTAHERTGRNVAAMTVEADGWEPLPDSVSFRSTVSYLYEQTRYREPEPGVAQPPIATRSKNRSASWRSDGRFAGEGLGAEHLARLAFELRYDSLSSSDQGFHRRTSESVAASNELSFWSRRFQLVPTLRFDHDDDFGSEWIPHLGVVVGPLPWLRIKANAERSYRAPDFDELYFPDEGFIRGNPNLRPEDAWNFDVGFELGFGRLSLLDDVKLQAAWFHQEIENSIVFQRISPSTIAPTNTSDAEVRGFELAGSFALLGWVGFEANWTHQDGELDRPRVPGESILFDPIAQPAGTAIPGQADDEYQLRMRVGPESGLFKVVAARRYTSKIHLSFSDSSTLSSRTVWDLSAAVDLAQVWRPDSHWAPRELLASVAVTNLTDESVRDSVGFPQPGRWLQLGLQARW